MKNSILVAASLLGFFALTACSSGSPDETDQSDDAIVAASAPGEEGGLCGGIAGIRCKDGLICTSGSTVGPSVKPAGLPSPGPIPDESGTCVRKDPPRPGELGGICGGIAGIVCKNGLTCVFPPGGGVKPQGLPGPVADELGTCLAALPAVVGLPIQD